MKLFISILIWAIIISMIIGYYKLVIIIFRKIRWKIIEIDSKMMVNTKEEKEGKNGQKRNK